jgi:ABC-type bacteriocin/lantibiotic exporter with double-glycine peptidase domain
LVLDCPEGYFCPEGSTSPIKCRDYAAFTCSKNSRREVVWVPLFIALVLLLLFFSIDKYYLKTTTQNKQSNTNKYKTVAIIEDYSDSANTSLVSTSPITVTFKDITLVTKKTVRISGVSGVIQPGKFTAILGGSGAGFFFHYNYLCCY